MRIFILEDNPDRIAKFKRSLIGHVVDVATTATQSKSLLMYNKYDLMFLDHDLGGQSYVESGLDTGWEVARYIVENDIACPTIIIHSCNPDGAKNIQNVIPSALKVPFVSLNIEKAVELAEREEIDDIMDDEIVEEPTEHKKVWKKREDGTLLHDGDCRIFGSKICTCGLLHYVSFLDDSEKVYGPSFQEDLGTMTDILDSL